MDPNSDNVIIIKNNVSLDQGGWHRIIINGVETDWFEYISNEPSPDISKKMKKIKKMNK